MGKQEYEVELKLVLQFYVRVLCDEVAEVVSGEGTLAESIQVVENLS